MVKIRPITVVFKDDVSVEYVGKGNYVVNKKCSLDQLSHMIQRAGGNSDEIIKKLLQDGKVSCEIA